jgi:arginine-tRNA-protein transferase
MGAEQARIIGQTVDFNCTYKPGQLRRVFSVGYASGNTQKLYSDLLPLGFMAESRSVTGHACITCCACVPLRIRAHDYPFSANERKILRLNGDLKLIFKNTRIECEHFDLFQRYAAVRHSENAMYTAMTAPALQSLLEPHSHMIELRSKRNKLVGVLVLDALDSGFNAYSAFYDPDPSKKRSLGTFMILKLIEAMRNDTPMHLYIGTWVRNNPKLDYKKRFHNLEMFAQDQSWRPFNPDIHHTGGKPSRVIPIQPV